MPNIGALLKNGRSHGSWLTWSRGFCHSSTTPRYSAFPVTVPGMPNIGALLKNGRSHGSRLTRDFFFVGTGPQGVAAVLGAAGALLGGEPSGPSWAKAAFPIRTTPMQTASTRAFVVINRL